MKYIEEWKNWFLTLPEKSFSGLCRNYLGKLNTPFNKHKLFEDLSAFVNRPKVHAALFSSMDELDHKILTIISLSGNSPEAPVVDLLTPEFSSWELRQRLTNLQERLILFKDTRDVYYITPPLADILENEVIDTSILFSSSPRKEGIDNPPWLTDDFLLAFKAYLLHSPPSLKVDGTLSKKSLTDLHEKFPLFAMNEGIKNLFIESSRLEGLWRDENRCWIYQEQDWNFITTLKHSQRINRINGRTVTTPEMGTERMSLDLTDGGFLIQSLEKSLDTALIYPRDTIYRIIQLILAEKRPQAREIARILENLITLGFLIEEEPETFGWNRAHEQNNHGPIPPVLHPNYELTLAPEMDFTLGSEIASAFELIRYDRVGQYHLTQGSYTRRSCKGESSSLKKILEETTGLDLPQNIDFLLTHWDTQIRGVRLLEGIVLKISPDRIPLFENNPLLTALYKETLAPGVYLLDPSQRNQWEPALLKMGITTMPAVEKAETQDEEITKKFNPPIPHGETINFIQGTSIAKTEFSRKPLHDKLQKMQLTKDEKEELADRIEKRVVLFPEQLNDAVSIREIREAKGLDYQAKIRLIQEALSSGHEFLEISWFSPDDDLYTKKIIPRHLTKEEEELYLNGPFLEEPGGKDFRIRVRKISRVRRRKLSFFSLS